MRITRAQHQPRRVQTTCKWPTTACKARRSGAPHLIGTAARSSAQRSPHRSARRARPGAPTGPYDGPSEPYDGTGDIVFPPGGGSTTLTLRAVRDRDSGFVNCDFREAADAESGVTVSTSVVVTDQGVSRGTPLGVDASVVPLTNVIRTQAFAQI